MAAHFDDEELSMSLSSPPERNMPPPRRHERAKDAVSPRSFAKDLPKGSKIEQRIGQYTIKKTLGEGSFGKVKLATHRVSGQEVALKIISRKKLISRDMAGRVEREIQYLQLLRHPHIIKL
jgi:carbon catabolite-derepressing protein kinase